MTGNGRHLLVVLSSLLLCGADVHISVPPLEADQELIARLTPWGDQIVAFGTRRAYSISEGGDHLEALDVPNCPAILDVAATERTAFALCQGRPGLDLAMRDVSDREGWSHADVPGAEVDRWGARVVARGERIAIVTSRSIHWRNGDRPWQVVELEWEDEFASTTPVKLLLSDDALWLGSNRGEFGGALSRAPIDTDGRLKPPVKLRELNVLGLAPANGGGVWVAGGLAHIFLREASLLRLRGDKIEVWLNERNLPDSDQIELAPPRYHIQPESYLQAFSLSREGRPLLLTDHALFEMFDDGPHPLMSGGFAVEVHRGHNILQIGLEDMIVTDRGDILIATGGLGVLRLVLDREEIAVHQLLVP